MGATEDTTDASLRAGVFEERNAFTASAAKHNVVHNTRAAFKSSLLTRKCIVCELARRKGWRTSHAAVCMLYHQRVPIDAQLVATTVIT